MGRINSGHDYSSVSLRGALGSLNTPTADDLAGACLVLCDLVRRLEKRLDEAGAWLKGLDENVDRSLDGLEERVGSLEAAAGPAAEGGADGR